MCADFVSSQPRFGAEPRAHAGSIRRASVLAITGLALCAAGSVSARAQIVDNEWTWIGGSSTVPLVPDVFPWGEPGVYGLQNVANVANIPGGRTEATSWTDSNGNFWVFGGDGFDSTHTPGILNDLWEYNPQTNLWTWMAGSNTVPSNGTGQPGIYGQLLTPAIGNTPGGRYGAAGWTDAEGNLWLFGGAGYDGAGHYGDLNDLWEFDISSGEWAWMAGSTTPGASGTSTGFYGTQGSFAGSNYPGARDSSVTWTDNEGNFWLFGGSGIDSLNGNGDLNDLWEFVPSTRQWAWMSGSSKINGASWAGVYGMEGAAAAGNTPGARQTPSGWIDASGNLWLFAGYGYTSTPSGAVASGFLNDVWEYTPATNEWAWMGGASQLPNSCISAPQNSCGVGGGVYGVEGQPSLANIPGGRGSPLVWLNSGKVWLLGGQGYDATGSAVFHLNDLWQFDPSTDQWTWVGGPSTDIGLGESGVYGAQGMANAKNIPGGRAYGSAWTGQDGTLWLMGGGGLDANGTIAYLNDVWAYGSPQPLTILASPTFNPPTGTYPTPRSVVLSDATSGATIYYTTDGTTPTTNSAVYNGPVTVNATGTIEAYAAAPGFAPSAVASGNYTITSPAADPPTFNPPAGLYTSSQSVAIADSTPGMTIYYAINGVPTTSSTPYTGPIAVSSSETIEALAAGPNYSNSAVASAAYTILYPAAAPAINPAPGTYDSAQSVTMTDSTPGTTIYYAINGVPTIRSTPYAGPVEVSSSETIEAIAAGPNNSSSTVTSAAYTILLPAAAPTFNPAAGTYTSSQSVTISDITPGTTIYYAINAVPTTSSTPYTGPITVGASETIEAIAAGPNNSSSAVASAAYTIQLPAAAPTINLAAGTYDGSQSVAITDSTPGTTIYYAINAVPTTSSTPYTGPITVSSSETIEAIAAGPNNSSSTVASAVYTILLPAAAPTFNPPAGTYDSQQSVAITDITPNTTIYYAINAVPTTSSTPYTGPITVASTKPSRPSPRDRTTRTAR